MLDNNGNPERHKSLLNRLSRYSTLAELHRSNFFSECSAEIDSLLGTAEIIPWPTAAPRIADFVRIAQWNLEKGKKPQAAANLFANDERLKLADVVLVNEADRGMIRSGNRHVARSLGAELGMNVAFAPACLELTKGIGEETNLPGENFEGMQGNAVLSRYPILSANVIRLPQCFEPYEFHEKRYGGRNCLWVKLQTGAGILWVGSTHLEVRNVPACRAAQMRKIMAALPGNARAPYLLGGDLNANCLPRGTRLRALSAAARLVLSNPETLTKKFLRPQPYEPLFQVAAREKFLPDGLNSDGATASVLIEASEDAGMVPAPIRNFVRQRIAAYHGVLLMKLDWFLGRNIHPLRAGEILDSASGNASCSPGCVPTVRVGPERISDHSPIFADFLLHSDAGCR